MKGLFVIALMVWANIWITPVSVAMGRSDTGGLPQKEDTADMPASEAPAVNDNDVAKRLEMLQFMEMLEHFDLIKDLDVLEGEGNDADSENNNHAGYYRIRIQPESGQGAG